MLIGFAFQANSCKSIKGSQKIKEAEKQEIARKKEAQEQHEKLIEAHHERQTIPTQEMMEKTKKRSESYNQAKKGSFIQRILGINPKHKKPKKKKRL